MYFTLYRVEGGFLWESGQKGPLQRRHKDHPSSTIGNVTSDNGGQKRNKEKVRVKILSDKNEANSSFTDVVRCGQCDKGSASLVSDSHLWVHTASFMWGSHNLLFRVVSSVLRTIVSFAMPSFTTRELLHRIMPSL